MGTQVRGPALCAMPESTLLVPPGWSGVVDEHGTVVLEGAPLESGRDRQTRSLGGRGGQQRSSERGALARSIRSSCAGDSRCAQGGLRGDGWRARSLSALGQHQGATRRSTALFDCHGEMAMQAEHIPVHLGSMPAAVHAVLEREQRPGVSWVLNDPFEGGTHLPDITVVTPFSPMPPARAGHSGFRAPTTPGGAVPHSSTGPPQRDPPAQTC